jgi:MarR family transcriptional regulator, organic hydroperoxide resistance regulator
MNEKEYQVQTVTQKLRMIFKAIQSHSKKIEKECGLSGAQLWMLSEVAAVPGVRVSHLAETLSIHASTCSNMLDKLENKDLVYRDRSKKDQRTVHLYVTEAGQNLLSNAPKPLQGKLSRGLDLLTPEQLMRLEDSLEGLVQTLKIPDDKGSFFPIPSE